MPDRAATPPRLVALRALGLGDLLAAVPALRAIARAFPRHHRILATTEFVSTLARVLPGVDEVRVVEELGALPPDLARADVAVNLHGRGPESHRRLVALRPGRLIAFRHEDVGESHAGAPWMPDEHEVPRWCRMLAHHGIDADPGQLSLAVPRRRRPHADAGLGTTIVHPGAASMARQWPWQRFAAVARHERRRGRRVLVTGSREERPLACAVADRAGLPRSSVFAGYTTVVDLLHLVADADRIVCGDTGIAHVATAVGTPSVVLFGPTPPHLWGPPSDGAHEALWTGRRGPPDGDEPFPPLLEISVEEVVDALDRVTPPPVNPFPALDASRDTTSRRAAPRGGERGVEGDRLPLREQPVPRRP